MDFISILSIFVLACFVGYYVVWSVTPALHTPLMSVTNAISSVIVVGALIAAAAAGSADLEMARAGRRRAGQREHLRRLRGHRADAGDVQEEGAQGDALRRRAAPAWVLLAYLVAGVCFILALRGLSSPESSRRGNRIGMIGMAIAVVTTLAVHEIASLAGDRRGAMVIGGAIGLVTARKIQMTAMPQLVAAFHSLVGMAAVLVGAAAFLNPEAFGIARSRRSEPSISHPAGQPDRDGPRRRHRRDHLLGLGDRLPQIQRQHVGQADPAAAAPRHQSRARWPRSSA